MSDPFKQEPKLGLTRATCGAWVSWCEEWFEPCIRLSCHILGHGLGYFGVSRFFWPIWVALWILPLQNEILAPLVWIFTCWSFCVGLGQSMDHWQDFFTRVHGVNVFGWQYFYCLLSLSLSPLNLDRRHHPDTWKCTGKQEQSGSKYLAGPLRRGSVPLGQKYLLAAAACWTWVLTASICCGRAIFLGCVSLFWACFFDFCFPASLLFCFCMRLCFYSPLLLCFSTFLLLRFSAFPASLLLCFLLFPASLLNYLLFCFSAFPSFLFFVLQITLKRCNITYYLNGLTPSAADPRREVHGTVDIHTTHSK